MSTPEKWFGEHTLEQPQRKAKDEPKKETKAKKKAPTKRKTKKKAAKPAQDEPEQAQELEQSPEPPPGDPEPPSDERAAQKPVEEDLPLGGELVEPEENKFTVTDKINRVSFVTEGQSEKGPWKLYNILTNNGTKIACFDQKLVEVAEEAEVEEYLCELQYKKTPKGLTLLAIDIIG
jgi:hypothetical protein